MGDWDAFNEEADELALGQAEELSRFSDHRSYLEVIIRTNNRVNIVAWRETELMAPGNSVEKNIEEGLKLVAFLENVIENTKAELDPDNVRRVAEEHDLG